jgi:pseudaminic acid biosynthesis-associated methylase
VNEQEAWWAGDFGDAYVKRNRVDWKKRSAFWRMILSATNARSVLEVGCNAGWNLLAMRDEDPTLKLRGVDLNCDALVEACNAHLDAREVGASEVGTLWRGQFDLVLTSGVLIHVAPEHLPTTMISIANASREWVVAVEYHATNETEVPYRGQPERLWKRDYGQLYREMGMKIEVEGAVSLADGFDDCFYWICRK